MGDPLRSHSLDNNISENGRETQSLSGHDLLNTTSNTTNTVTLEEIVSAIDNISRGNFIRIMQGNYTSIISDIIAVQYIFYFKSC